MNNSNRADLPLLCGICEQHSHSIKRAHFSGCVCHLCNTWTASVNVK